jgi:CubicO group peptidase (beta-lactamase class C family)
MSITTDRTAATTDPIPSSRVDAVRAMLAEAVDDGFFAGVAACAVQRGEVLHHDVFGDRDVEEAEPMTSDTIFRLASSTKPIIAVAMMLLHEEGKWDFDDEVARFIPAFADLQVKAKDGSLVDPVQPMRMRHLMSHAAGFAGLGNVFGGDASSGVGMRRPKDLPDLIDRLAAQPLAFHPGKRFLYGVCCDVQGHVIEQLSGQPLDVFLQERIFEPLDMVDTAFFVHAAKTDRVASLYDHQDGKLVRLNRPDPERIAKRPSYLSGGGGLWGTPDDYQRFCQMLVDEGGPILRPESVRRMRDDLLEPQVYVQIVPGYTLPGTRFGTNMSVITEPQGDTAMYPAGTYSWGGAFGTYFWIDPVNELFVSGMVQIANGGAQHLGREMPYPDLKKRTAELLYGAG